jgi:hypothetical protein
MDHLTSVGTINASNFVRAVIQPDGMGAIHFLMPVTDFEYNGQPVTPPGFDKEYGLYLTLDGTNIGHPDGSVDFTSLNVTLWADPGNDAGTPSVSETSDPAFTNGTANDIVLATGTLVSGSMSLDPTTNTRHADLVEQLTPTLDGTVLLDGSIKPGTLLEEQATAPLMGLPFTSYPPSTDGGPTITTVSGGTAQITLDPQGTILLPNISHNHLQLADVPRFIHGNHDGHHADHGRGRD